MRFFSVRIASLVAAVALAMTATGLASQSGDRPQSTPLWVPVTNPFQPRPGTGLRYLAIRHGPLQITGANLRADAPDGTVVLDGVTVMNPRLTEATGAAVWWRLYDDADLETPVASGVTRAAVFAHPLAIHDSETLRFGLEIPLPRPSSVYRLEVGVESVVYEDGSGRHRDQ